MNPKLVLNRYGDGTCQQALPLDQAEDGCEEEPGGATMCEYLNDKHESFFTRMLLLACPPRVIGAVFTGSHL